MSAMTNRGRPLPFSLREQIKQLRAEKSLREVAAALGVAVNTVRKYEKR